MYGQTSLRRTDRSHTTKILRTARRPYDVLTAVAQRKILRTARRPYDALTAVAQRKSYVWPDIPTTY